MSKGDVRGRGAVCLICRSCVCEHVAPPYTALHLTGREMDVLECLAGGLMAKDIAELLGLSPGTAKVYICRLLPKLHVGTGFQAALWARDNADLLRQWKERRLAKQNERAAANPHGTALPTALPNAPPAAADYNRMDQIALESLRRDGFR